MGVRPGGYAGGTPISDSLPVACLGIGGISAEPDAVIGAWVAVDEWVTEESLRNRRCVAARLHDDLEERRQREVPVIDRVSLEEVLLEPLQRQPVRDVGEGLHSRNPRNLFGKLGALLRCDSILQEDRDDARVEGRARYRFGEGSSGNRGRELGRWGKARRAFMGELPPHPATTGTTANARDATARTATMCLVRMTTIRFWPLCLSGHMFGHLFRGPESTSC